MTSCVTPVWSRTSIKIRPPWSRRALTQPLTVTVAPICSVTAELKILISVILHYYCVFWQVLAEGGGRQQPPCRYIVRSHHQEYGRGAAEVPTRWSVFQRILQNCSLTQTLESWSQKRRVTPHARCRFDGGSKPD